MVCHSDRARWVHRSPSAVRHVTGRAELRVVVLFAFALNIASCEAIVNRVSVQSGATSAKPVFVITDTTGRQPSGAIYGLSVVKCGADSASWQIASDGSQSAPSRVEYGVAPKGYIVRAGPDTLRTGCYDVFVTHGRRARFYIDGTGRLLVEVRRDTAGR